MNETSKPRGAVGDAIDRVGRHLVDLGQQAETLFAHYDFGFPREFVRHHIDRVAGDFAALDRAVPLPELRTPALDALWDHEQSVRYAAGAAMISARYRGSMTPENAALALAAKALHEFQTDLLDDLIDEGHYSFEEARALYQHSLESMTADEFDPTRFRSQLASIIREDQSATVDLLVSLSSKSRKLLLSSPNWLTVRPELREANQRLAIAQPLTVFQKSESQDIEVIRVIASTFPAPHADLAWHERFARAVAHGTGLSLIDLCFLEMQLTPSELRAHQQAWYYYDTVISLVNNLLDVAEDARNGLVSIAFMAMKESEVLVPGLDVRSVRLSMRDYEQVLRRMAELSRRAIACAHEAMDDPDAFYPFLALMIPVVMFSDPEGSGNDLLHAYLRALAPAIRDASRPSLAFHATTARGIRSDHPCFARIASSSLSR